MSQPVSSPSSDSDIRLFRSAPALIAGIAVMFPHTFVGACLLAVAQANPIARSMQVLESRDAPASFINKGAAPPDTMLTLRVHLASSDIPGLENALMSVSTPGSALYGQHLSKAEVRFPYRSFHR